MKKFDLNRSKRSPLPGKRVVDVKIQPIDIDDATSDYTDSEPGGGSTDVDYQEYRSATPDPSKTREALESIRHKIEKIKMEIQREQIAKEDHVKDYLDLSSRASNDEAKAKNIKIVFEKNNSVSANKIANLQKKLERYHTDLRRIEQHGASSHRAAKEVLKDVGQGIKDFGGSFVGNIRTATDALVSKPKDHIGSAGSGKSKSGSVDNLHSLSAPISLMANDHGKAPQLPSRDTESPVSPTGSTTLPANFKFMPAAGPADLDNDIRLVAETASISEGSYHIARDVSPQNSTSTSPHIIQTINQQAIEPLLQKLNSNADSLERVAREIEILRSQMEDFQEEVTLLRSFVEEDRVADRYDRMEEHLNDFVELTQTEITNVKQEMANMEEKMDYQLEERTRDLQDSLENANTRMTKMELQSHHQQLISMEGVDNANARILLTKAINVLLAFLAVALVFLSTVSNIVGPLLNAKWKVITVIVMIFALIFTSSRWDSSSVVNSTSSYDASSHPKT